VHAGAAVETCHLAKRSGWRTDERTSCDFMLMSSNVTFFIGDISKPEDIANALEKVRLGFCFVEWSLALKIALAFTMIAHELVKAGPD